MTALLSLCLGGCTFSAPQLEGLVQIFKPEIKSEYAWVAQVGREVSSVTAVGYDSSVIFASSEGGAIVFDGWRIRSVNGFGLASPLRIEVTDDGVEYVRSVSLVSHACGPWQKRFGSRIDWVQVCEADFSYENRITLDSLDRIIEISQVVSADGTRVVLRKK